MTQLSKTAKNEFRAIYQKEFGKDLSDDEADERGSRLLRFFAILVRDKKDTPKEPTTEVRL